MARRARSEKNPFILHNARDSRQQPYIHAWRASVVYLVPVNSVDMDLQIITSVEAAATFFNRTRERTWQYVNMFHMPYQFSFALEGAGIRAALPTANNWRHRGVVNTCDQSMSARLQQQRKLRTDRDRSQYELSTTLGSPSSAGFAGRGSIRCGCDRGSLHGELHISVLVIAEIRMAQAPHAGGGV
jgi:hypothetical protein